MLFLNPWLLAALAGIAIPIIIHLVRRQAAKPIDWAAMRFLMDTLSERRRRIEWEDLLLMAARCLLLALAALVVARPFVPPNSAIPWSFVLPAALLAVVLFGASFVAGRKPLRGGLRALAMIMVLVIGALVAFEQFLHLRRFETSGRRDVAIVIDASSSMGRATARGTVFEDAIEEAKQIVGQAPRGTSFVVVLGGPAPRALSQTPLSHRADVLAQLAELRPVGGSFRAHEALGVATLALAEGYHSSKQLIVLTDGQRHGWRFGDAGAWQSLEEAWESLPEKPKLLLRRLPVPDRLKNAGIAGITTARTLVGTDRPSLIRVAVENSGTEAVAPQGVTLEVDGTAAGRAPLGMLAPGQVETVEFRHRFENSGPRVVTARLEVRDELAEDDRADHVVPVSKRVRVLLVDGNPAGGFFERAAGHMALALAPSQALVRGREAGERFLMDPRVVRATELRVEDLREAEVVVLADVPRLPATLARQLANQTTAGGGLVVIAGPRSDPNFHNAWSGPDGLLLPLQLGAEATSEEGVSPAAATFQHESLNLFRDEATSDLRRATVRRWRRASEHPDRGVVGAAFGNGDPWLAGSIYGNGRCLLLTCALDARSGNLPARVAFVPLVHELVAWAAGGGPGLNVEASWSPSVVLSQSTGGLAARVAAKGRAGVRRAIERIDPTIDWNWEHGAPAPRIKADDFVVQWTGRLLPPSDGEYLFEAEVDDRVTLSLGGRSVLATSLDNPRSGKATLNAGKPVPVEVNFEEDSGEAFVRLFWTPPGGRRELIPPSAWLPPLEGESTPLEALDPLGLSRTAAIAFGRRGKELRIAGDAVPGLYQVKLTDDARAAAPELGTAESLPLVVKRDIRESRSEPFTGDDLKEARSRIDTLEPAGSEDVLAVLSGRGFGREITRMVAIAALVLLLLESALARWVSRSRRAGEAEAIDFGDSGPVSFGDRRRGPAIAETKT